MKKINISFTPANIIPTITFFMGATLAILPLIDPTKQLAKDYAFYLIGLVFMIGGYVIFAIHRLSDSIMLQETGVRSLINHTQESTVLLQEKFNDLIKIINAQTDAINLLKMSNNIMNDMPNNFPVDNKNVKTFVINSEEDLEKLKDMLPKEMSDEIMSNLFKELAENDISIGSSKGININSPEDISKINDATLEELLDTALEEEDYNKAKLFQEELSKRNKL
jgi:hypothetical protein